MRPRYTLDLLCVQERFLLECILVRFFVALYTKLPINSNIGINGFYSNKKKSESTSSEAGPDDHWIKSPKPILLS